MTTIVAPTGVDHSIDMIIPKNAVTTANPAEKTVVLLKDLQIFIAVMHGKTMIAETRMAPTNFMAITMVTAETTAMNVLKSSVFVPVAFAKFSSKVTAKIVL